MKEPTEAARLLQEPTAAKLYRIIGERPGVPVVRLTALMGMSWRDIDPFLRPLTRAGLVVCVSAGRRRHYFRHDAPSDLRAATRQIGLLMVPTTARIARLVLEAPGLDMEAIRRRARVPHRTAQAAAQRLALARLIESPSTTRYEQLTPGKDLKRLLACVDAIRRDP